MSTQIEVPDGLDKHCPWWTEELRNYKTLDELRESQPVDINDTIHLDIFHARFCLVAEKHGFSVRYYNMDNPDYCEICDRFSLWFITPDPISFNQRLKDFKKHCDEFHPVVVKK